MSLTMPGSRGPIPIKGIRDEIRLYDIAGFGRQRIEK